MDDEQQPGGAGERARVKKPYHSPRLTDLGKVDDLTGGGVGTSVENTGKDMQLTKRP